MPNFDKWLGEYLGNLRELHGVPITKDNYNEMLGRFMEELSVASELLRQMVEHCLEEGIE